jgi:serine/threonine protein kinase/Flp pilus assembly protein TadD
LAEAFVSAWRSGSRPSVETFLADRPDLLAEPSVAIRLIYEEYCLRLEAGERDASDELLARFPAWHDDLRALLHCHRVLAPPVSRPAFPEVGETLGEFRLLAELGRGALGRTFLASQAELADRPMVLKLTPNDRGEHLSLARLQHTNVVPLYFVHDLPDRGLRVLGMPYIGGATLDRLLVALETMPAARRTGHDVLVALSAESPSAPVPCPAAGPARRLLERSSYVEAICWIGAQLAESLHHAHERGLVHMDLKPSNVLLAADGQPLLLDFHLARAPIVAGALASEPVGGTPAYMSPEQHSALQEAARGRAAPADVDARSDVYSLGLLLYESLGGRSPRELEGENRPRLERCNPNVSPGLSDVIHKCLAPEPKARYADAAQLAGDLRAHLAAKPLAGVANRSARERWRKWQRRRPYALGLVAGLLLLIAATITALGLVAEVYRRDGARREAAQRALAEGRLRLSGGDTAGAAQSFQRGLGLAALLPKTSQLTSALVASLNEAQRSDSIRRIHEQADRARSLDGLTPLPPEEAAVLLREVSAAWDAGSRIVEENRGQGAGGKVDPALRSDLLDLAVMSALLLAGESAPAHIGRPRRDAIRRLLEANAKLGPSWMVDLELREQAEAAGISDVARAAASRLENSAPATARDHYALARWLLRRGDLDRADRELNRATALSPGDFWTRYAQGLCAYRSGRHADAVASFGICIALAPERAECYYNRSLAFAALGEHQPALRDVDRALELAPTLPGATLHRDALLRSLQPNTDASASQAVSPERQSFSPTSSRGGRIAVPQAGGHGKG